MLNREACERRVYRLATLLTGNPVAATRVIESVVDAQPDLRRLDNTHMDRLTVLRSRELTPGRLVVETVPPAAAEALTRANGQIDIRDILPTIRVPTLLIHATGDRTLPIAFSRYMVERIPGAKLVEIDSDDHLPWLEGGDEILRAIEEFLTGTHHDAGTDRVLSTIMFTDIVGSTEILAETGDANWRALLGAHDEAIRGNFAAFNGREMNTTGDGFLAIFDGPARAVRCAQNICADAERVGVSVRVGLHTGECELRGEDISGLAVHIASRITDLAPSGGVLVSRTVRDLVAGSGLRFEATGSHRLKGVPDEWQLYGVA